MARCGTWVVRLKFGHDAENVDKALEQIHRQILGNDDAMAIASSCSDHFNNSLDCLIGTVRAERAHALSADRHCLN